MHTFFKVQSMILMTYLYIVLGKLVSMTWSLHKSYKRIGLLSSQEVLWGFHRMFVCISLRAFSDTVCLHQLPSLLVQYLF